MTQPHGGVLQERLVSHEQFASRAKGLKRITVDARALNDLELLAVGALSPLTGFMNEAAYRSVVESMRLPDGTVWPLPITLAVKDAPNVGESVVLCDDAGREWAVLSVNSKFTRDPKHEARHVLGTEDVAHPGVAVLLEQPTTLIGGEVEVAPLPT
ncbi:MAG: sulfate adenylyltransferase, partial [Archangium sp.]|nr:sulfate adenylyltransferase [Archangium sp.]